jgi:hypothetical protein
VEIVESAALVTGGNVLKVFGLDFDFASTPALALAVAVDGGVDRDPREPGSGLGASIDLRALLEEPHERVLDDFKGILRVSQIPAGDPVEPLLVPCHERRQRRLVPRRQSGEQLGVGDAVPGQSTGRDLRRVQRR